MIAMVGLVCHFSSRRTTGRDQNECVATLSAIVHPGC